MPKSFSWRITLSERRSRATLRLPSSSRNKKRLELVHQTLLAPNPIPPSKSRGFKIHNSKSELRCIKVAASHRVNIHRRHCLRRIKKTKKCKGFAAKSETKNRQGGRPRHRIILSKRISRKRKKKNAAASLGAPFFLIRRGMADSGSHSSSPI